MDAPQTDRGVPTMGRNELPDGPPTPSRPQSPHFDASEALPDYANSCRIFGSPEELVMDSGYNLEPTGKTTQTVAVTQRVIIGWHTAKRLLAVLQQVVGRHEAAFGALETDVPKRLGVGRR
jgi:hypothetical protein